MKFTLLLFTLFTTLLFHTLSYSNNNLTPEEYVNVFSSGTNLEKQKAAESLAWAGLSSPKIFNAIEKDVLATYKDAELGSEAEFSGWMIKALAFSGNEKYRKTLELVSNNADLGTIRRYANWSLEKLDEYKLYNPIIAPSSWPENTHPALNQRLTNMINSDHLLLMRTSSKQIIVKNRHEKKLLDSIEKAVRKYAYKPHDRRHTNTTLWLCRALASSREDEYIPLFKDIIKNSPSKNIRIRVKRYLKAYY
ncbi:MAG: hypothetical protein K6L73_04030 [Cellvibrionaceae bacterium]